jgi:predicted  nucleic acid-binding Zn-ribbon protein
MATNSKYVTDKDIMDFRNHIETLREVRKEIILANNAGVPLNYTVKDIDDQIASLETLIRAYQSK